MKRRLTSCRWQNKKDSLIQIEVWATLYQIVKKQSRTSHLVNEWSMPDASCRPITAVEVSEINCRSKLHKNIIFNILFKNKLKNNNWRLCSICRSWSPRRVPELVPEEAPSILRPTARMEAAAAVAAEEETEKWVFSKKIPLHSFLTLIKLYLGFKLFISLSFFKKWAIPGLFFVYFRSFLTLQI